MMGTSPARTYILLHPSEECKRNLDKTSRFIQNRLRCRLGAKNAHFADSVKRSAANRFGGAAGNARSGDEN
jgi:hypothetical protein